MAVGRLNILAKVYLDTSVIIALTNLRDHFYNTSTKFMQDLRELDIACTVGPPILLEIGKAVQRKGVESGLTIIRAIDKYEIDLAELDSDRLLKLANQYFAHRVAGTKYSVDLMHYASATLLNCSHLASWDKEHFNQRIEKKINKVNSATGLTSLKVGDPVHIARSLEFGQE